MGLLDPTDPQSAMLTNIALGLLSAGGPSARPVSLGQAMGEAGQMGMQGYQQGQQNQMRQMQLDQIRKRMAFKPDLNSPNLLRDAVDAGALDIKDVLPMLVRDQKTTWQDGGDKLYQLDAYGKPTGLTIPKGMAPSFHTINTGGKQVLGVASGNGFNTLGSLNNDASPDAKLTAGVTMRGQNMTDSRERLLQSPDYKAAVATAEGVGKGKADAITTLPATEASVSMSIKQIDDMLKSPGFGQSVGVGFPGLKYIPGSDEADFSARLDQIKGSAFLQAYNTLKGGGQITEVEGKKATDAITRMSTSQSEKEFIKAANDFKDVLRSGLSRARMRAGTAAGMPAEPTNGGVKFLGFE